MFAFKPHKDPICQVAFSPDGASIATCGRKPIVCVSDAVTGKSQWQSNHGHHTGTGLAYSPDGTRLATVGWFAVNVFDAESGEGRREYLGGGCGVAFTPNGACVVSGNPHPRRGVIRTFVQTGFIEAIDALGEIPIVNRLRYSPDGRFLAVLVPVGGLGVNVVDAQTGELIARAAVSHPTNGVRALAFHPTAPVIVYSGGPNLVVYDLETRSPVARRSRSSKYIQDAAFTPDGKHLITVSNDTMAVLWETTGWTEVREFAWDIGPLKSIAVAPDGSRAACAGARGRVVVWDLDV